MILKETIVDLASVDSRDQTFRITSNTESDDLVESIRTVGLINSPVLIVEKSRFRIVCGFRRIHAAGLLGWEEIPAKILPPDTVAMRCVKLAISDNRFQRPMNLLEESRAYAMISGLVESDHEKIRTARSVGLSGSLSRIRKIETICRLPVPVQQGVQNNTISLSTALELSNMPSDTAIAFADLFSTLKLSLNKQRELVRTVEEIAIRERATIADVLRSHTVQNPLHNPDMDRSQKVQHLRDALKKRRFPEITRAEDRFDRYLKTLKLGPGVKLMPPPYFEGITYTLSMRFNSLDELQQHKKTVGRLIQNPSLKKILDRKHLYA